MLFRSTWVASVWVKGNRNISNTICELFLFEANSSGTYTNFSTASFYVTTEWQRVSITRTLSDAGTAYVQVRLDGPNSYTAGDVIWWDGLQVERNVYNTGYPTRFTTGTRTLANGLLDIAGGATIDGNISYTDDTPSLPYWNGPTSFDYLYATESWSHRGTNSFTYEAWFKHNTDNGYDKILVGKPGGHIGLMAWGGTQYFRLNASGFKDITISESYNTWYHLVEIGRAHV